MKVYGPYSRKADRYSHVVIIHDDGHRQTMSYHKYLWEQEYGPVEDGYEIHHIDENPENNSLENLEKVLKIKHLKLHSDWIRLGFEASMKNRKPFTHGTLYGWQNKKCKCIKCLLAKRLWQDKRNARRRQASVEERQTRIS